MTALKKYAELRKKLSNPAVGSNRNLRKLSLSLLDHLESVGRTLAVNHEAACSLVDENDELNRKLEAAEKRIAEHNFENQLLANADRDITALRQRIAELEARTVTVKLPADYRNNDGSINADMFNTCEVVGAFREALAAAGIGVKGE